MKNITLTLYAFHLKQYLGDSPETTQTQGSQMWESLVQLSQTHPFPELKKLKTQLISYHPDHQGQYTYQPQNEATHPGECLTHQQTEITLGEISTPQGFKLTGEIEPYLLNDTYCLSLTLHPTNDWQDELDVSDLTAFQPHRLIEEITADLGKVLVFYGEQNQSPKNLTSHDAQPWATALCANTSLNPEFRGQLTLFNCPVFWFEAEGLTLWILLAKPGQFDGQKFSDNAQSVRGLLWSFLKINATYAQVEIAYNRARISYNTLDDKITNFHTILTKTPQERLENLEQMIATVPQELLYFYCCLRDLKTHHATIETNINNFTTTLNNLIAAGGTELQAWSIFPAKTYPHYLRQIQSYLNHLEPGKEVFSDLINTIRTTTEIERAKNEQLLQHHIQSVGIGIAAGAIVASSSGLMIQPKTERLTLGDVALHPFWWALLFSAVCAFGSWRFADLIFKRLRGDRLPWPFPQRKTQ